jgi:hypothetical protein
VTLKDLVVVTENNSECVVLKVKDGKSYEMFTIGFTGKEKYIRVTKGDQHILSIMENDGNTYSWVWSPNRYILVAYNLDERRKKIVKCLEELGIDITK